MFVRLDLVLACEQFFILMAHRVPLYDYVTFYSPILLLMSTVIVSRFCLLHIMMQ